MNRIVVESTLKKYDRYKVPLRQAARSILLLLGEHAVSVEVFLLSDSAIKALNSRWRKKRKATNVLAFPEPLQWASVGSSKKEVRMIGQVYLAPDYIAHHRESLTKLLIHGVLHLFGYDHKKKNDRIKMEMLEHILYGKLPHRIRHWLG